MSSRKLWVTLSLFMAFALVVAACAPAAATGTVVPTAAEGGVETQAPTTAATMAAETPTTGGATAAASPTGATVVASPTGAATAGTAGPTPTLSGTAQAAASVDACSVLPDKYKNIGGTVDVLATWGGAEQDAFMAMVAPYEKCTGAKLQYEGTRDLPAVLTTRVQGGNPPDVAGLPGPGQLQTFAQAGDLIPLNKFLDMTKIQQEYDSGWTDLTTVNGNLYGIFAKASVKSQIWYDPKAFQAGGYTVPTNWSEMQALEQKMIADGHTPWCIALESGAASGWPGTDWIEDFVLQQSGVDTYTKWYQGQIPWTDASIKNAWTAWGDIVNNPKMIYGGQQYVLSTNFGNAPFPLFSNPPGCYMTHSADFITGFITTQFPDLVAGQDFNFFPFPPTGSGKEPVEIGGDLVGAFNDTPQTEALIYWLTTSQAQSIWAAIGGYLAPNKTVPSSVYPDELTRAEAKFLASAPAVRFDASDMMPAQVQQAFYSGILNYVSNPNSLDSDLQQIQSVAQGAYSSSGATPTP